MRKLIAVLLCATSAFAWPWSDSGEKKATPEDQARIKDSLQLEEVKNLQAEVSDRTRELQSAEAENNKKSEQIKELQSALTEKDTGYRSMSINSSYGFYKVEVSSEDGVHDEGLLDGRGKLLVPAVYAGAAALFIGACLLTAVFRKGKQKTKFRK